MYGKAGRNTDKQMSKHQNEQHCTCVSLAETTSFRSHSSVRHQDLGRCKTRSIRAQEADLKQTVLMDSLYVLIQQSQLTNTAHIPLFFKAHGTYFCVTSVMSEEGLTGSNPPKHKESSTDSQAQTGSLCAAILCY